MEVGLLIHSILSKSANESVYLDSLLRVAYTRPVLARKAFVDVINTNAIHSIKEDYNNE